MYRRGLLERLPYTGKTNEEVGCVSRKESSAVNGFNRLIHHTFEMNICSCCCQLCHLLDSQAVILTQRAVLKHEVLEREAKGAVRMGGDQMPEGVAVVWVVPRVVHRLNGARVGCTVTRAKLLCQRDRYLLKLR